LERLRTKKRKSRSSAKRTSRKVQLVTGLTFGKVYRETPKGPVDSTCGRSTNLVLLGYLVAGNIPKWKQKRALPSAPIRIEAFLSEKGLHPRQLDSTRYARRVFDVARYIRSVYHIAANNPYLIDKCYRLLKDIVHSANYKYHFGNCKTSGPKMGLKYFCSVGALRQRIQNGSREAV